MKSIILFITHRKDSAKHSAAGNIYYGKYSYKLDNSLSLTSKFLGGNFISVELMDRQIE